jgi:hypothetical protein
MIDLNIKLLVVVEYREGVVEIGLMKFGLSVVIKTQFIGDLDRFCLQRLNLMLKILLLFLEVTQVD